MRRAPSVFFAQHEAALDKEQAANQCRPRAYTPRRPPRRSEFMYYLHWSVQWGVMNWVNQRHLHLRPTCNNQIFSAKPPRVITSTPTADHKTCNSKSSMKIDGNKTSERSERDKSAFICRQHTFSTLTRHKTASYLFIFYLCTYTHSRG